MVTIKNTGVVVDSVEVSYNNRTLRDNHPIAVFVVFYAVVEITKGRSAWKPEYFQNNGTCVGEPWSRN